MHPRRSWIGHESADGLLTTLTFGGRNTPRKPCSKTTPDDVVGMRSAKPKCLALELIYCFVRKHSFSWRYYRVQEVGLEHPSAPPSYAHGPNRTRHSNVCVGPAYSIRRTETPPPRSARTNLTIFSICREESRLRRLSQNVFQALPANTNTSPKSQPRLGFVCPKSERFLGRS